MKNKVIALAALAAAALTPQLASAQFAVWDGSTLVYYQNEGHPTDITFEAVSLSPEAGVDADFDYSVDGATLTVKAHVTSAPAAIEGCSFAVAGQTVPVADNSSASVTLPHYGTFALTFSYTLYGCAFTSAKQYVTYANPAAAEAVDLGLSVKWAPINIGATAPEDYGFYFAWGETTAKETYDWSTYKWMNEGKSSWSQINKYTYADGQTEACWYDQDGNFIGDGKTTLDPADDAATAAWGSDWRMPTYAEWDELNTECTWTWTTVNEVNGYTVTGPNGNSIFLPAAGYRYGSDLDLAGSYGLYWSSELYSGYSYYAHNCDFSSGNHYANISSLRYFGQSVRAVAPGIASAE